MAGTRMFLAAVICLLLAVSSSAQDFRFMEGWTVEGNAFMDTTKMAVDAKLSQVFPGNVSVSASAAFEGDLLQGSITYGLDEAYVRGSLSQYLVWFAGRQRMAWGPQKHESLVLSGNAPSYGTLGYELRFLGARYIRFYGSLETVQRRFLIGHRFETEPVPSLRLGVSEAAVVSGSFSPLMFNPIPLWPLSLSQEIASGQIAGHDSLVNTVLGFDVQYDLEDRGFLYGEYLTGQPEGRQTAAFRVGADYEVMKKQKLAVFGDYTHIADGVYLHSNPEVEWVHRGESLGSPLGTDVSQFRAGIRMAVENDMKLECRWTGTQRNEPESEALSSYTERKNRLAVGWSKQYGPDWTVRVDVFQEWVKNPEFKPGEKTGAGFEVELTFHLKEQQ